MAASPRLDKIRALLAADDSDPMLHYMLAMEHISLEDPAAAADAFRTLTERFPDYVPAYFQYGKALMALGRNAEALHVLDRGQAAALQAGDAHTAEEIAGLRGMIGDA
jgi:predicted Zn-dependent protease